MTLMIFNYSLRLVDILYPMLTPINKHCVFPDIIANRYVHMYVLSFIA